MLASNFLHYFSLNFHFIAFRNEDLFVTILLNQQDTVLACAQDVGDDKPMAVLVQGVVSLLQENRLICLQLRRRKGALVSETGQRDSQGGSLRFQEQAP